MSTYTDLRNLSKETINVDFKTRETYQEVHFENEKNKYKGQFENCKISKSSITDNSTISDSELISTQIDCSTITNSEILSCYLKDCYLEDCEPINSILAELSGSESINTNYKNTLSTTISDLTEAWENEEAFIGKYKETEKLSGILSYGFDTDEAQDYYRNKYLVDFLDYQLAQCLDTKNNTSDYVKMGTILPILLTLKYLLNQSNDKEKDYEEESAEETDDN